MSHLRQSESHSILLIEKGSLWLNTSPVHIQVAAEKRFDHYRLPICMRMGPLGAAMEMTMEMEAGPHNGLTRVLRP